MYSNLGLTVTWNGESVNFLDITLEGKMEEGKVISELYRKPSSGNTIIQAESCHSRHTILAIPTGEYIRAKRAFSKPIYYDQEKKTIDLRLQDRG